MNDDMPGTIPGTMVLGVALLWFIISLLHWNYTGAGLAIAWAEVLCWFEVYRSRRYAKLSESPNYVHGYRRDRLTTERPLVAPLQSRRHYLVEDEPKGSNTYSIFSVGHFTGDAIADFCSQQLSNTSKAELALAGEAILLSLLSQPVLSKESAISEEDVREIVRQSLIAPAPAVPTNQTAPTSNGTSFSTTAPLRSVGMAVSLLLLIAVMTGCMPERKSADVPLELIIPAGFVIPVQPLPAEITSMCEVIKVAETQLAPEATVSFIDTEAKVIGTILPKPLNPIDPLVGRSPSAKERVRTRLEDMKAMTVQNLLPEQGKLSTATASAQGPALRDYLSRLADPTGLIVYHPAELQLAPEVVQRCAPGALLACGPEALRAVFVGKLAAKATPTNAQTKLRVVYWKPDPRAFLAEDVAVQVCIASGARDPLPQAIIAALTEPVTTPTHEWVARPSITLASATSVLQHSVAPAPEPGYLASIAAEERAKWLEQQRSKISAATSAPAPPLATIAQYVKAANLANAQVLLLGEDHASYATGDAPVLRDVAALRAALEKHAQDPKHSDEQPFTILIVEPQTEAAPEIPASPPVAAVSTTTPTAEPEPAQSQATAVSEQAPAPPGEAQATNNFFIFADASKKRSTSAMHPDFKDAVPLEGALFHYAFGSLELDGEGMAALKKAVRDLEAMPECGILVLGYSDDLGTVEAQASVAQKRASAIAELLRKRLPGRKVTAIPCVSANEQQDSSDFRAARRIARIFTVPPKAQATQAPDTR